MAAYATTFVSRQDLYPIQLTNGSYVSVHRPLTDGIIAAHLKGNITIGAYALDKNGWAKWVCFDADDEQHWQGLRDMAQATSLFSEIPSYLELSRRGGHLWTFTDSIPGVQARRFGMQLLKEHELPLRKKDAPGIELYPKQDATISGPGSLMRLPLGIHALTGKRYHFITPEGKPLAPTIRDQIAVLANPQRVPLSSVDKILEQAPEVNPISPTPHFVPRRDEDIIGPPSERIKAIISVYDFVAQYVELDADGKGHCPFHDGMVKSFQVNVENNYWHCYAGCGGGSIIDFWMHWRKAHNKKGDFKSTIRDLAKMLLPK